MCNNCNFETKKAKKELYNLLELIDKVIGFKGKKIDNVSVNSKQYAMLRDALPIKEIELHTPMRRHGVLIKRVDQ